MRPPHKTTLQQLHADAETTAMQAGLLLPLVEHLWSQTGLPATANPLVAPLLGLQEDKVCPAVALRLLRRALALLRVLCQLLKLITTCPASAHACWGALAGCCMHLACTRAQARGLLSSCVPPSQLQPGWQQRLIHVPSHSPDCTQQEDGALGIGVGVGIGTQQAMQVQGPWVGVAQLKGRIWMWTRVKSRLSISRTGMAGQAGRTWAP